MPILSIRGAGGSLKVLNDEDGLCRTLKSQYQKNSVANFVRGGTFGATGVIRKIENASRNHRQQRI